MVTGLRISYFITPTPVLILHLSHLYKNELKENNNLIPLPISFSTRTPVYKIYKESCRSDVSQLSLILVNMLEKACTQVSPKQGAKERRVHHKAKLE